VSATKSLQGVVLYDANGVELTVVDGVAVPAGTRGLLIAGQETTGEARFVRVDDDGTLRVVGTATGDGNTALSVADEDVAILLGKVLTELRKLNFLLRHTWELSLDDEDVQ